MCTLITKVKWGGVIHRLTGKYTALFMNASNLFGLIAWLGLFNSAT